MIVQHLRTALVGAGLLFAPFLFAAPGAPEVPGDERGEQKADDPLPLGAKVRYGVSRPILRNTPAVALVPPGFTTFLAPTTTGGIRSYDVGTGRPLDKQGIVGPGQVFVSGDGKRAVVSRPGALTVVEVATKKRLLAIEPPEGVILVGVAGVSFSDDGKILAYGARGRDRKGVVVVLDVEKNEQLAQVTTAQDAPVFPELSADGKTLATLGPPMPAPTFKETQPGTKPGLPTENTPDGARTAQVWDVATGTELFKARVTGMGGIVVAAAFTTDGTRLALSAGNGPIDVWDVKTGKRLHTLLGGKGQGLRVAFSPDGKTIASIDQSYRLQRWGADGKPKENSIGPFGVPVAAITRLTFADNERVIAWLTAHQFAFAWEATAPSLLSPEMTHSAAIRSVALRDADKSVFTSGVDGKVFGWDMESGKSNNAIHLAPTRLPGQPMIQPIVNLSADATLAVWPNLGASEVFDLATKVGLFVVPMPSSPPAPVQISHSPDGLKLITVSRQAEGKKNGSCTIWDLTTRQRVGEFDVAPTSGAVAPTAILSPDGTRMVIALTRQRFDGTALTFLGYDVKTGKLLAEVEEVVKVSGSVSMAIADNEWVVVANTAGRIWKVNYAKGGRVKEIDLVPARGETPVYGPIVFSPDGKQFAVCVVGQAFTTYGVRVYDFAEGKALQTYLGHRGPVSALRFTTDGKFLASGSQDTSVLLWDLSKKTDGK